MDEENIRVGIYNFFVSLELIPVILYNFIITWLPINSTVNKASKIFSEKLLEIELSEETSILLTKEYASVKDHIFEEFLKRKNRIQTLNPKKSGGLGSVLIRMLPCRQVLLRIKKRKYGGYYKCHFPRCD